MPAGQPQQEVYIPLQFPAAGLNLSHAYDSQPNLPTQDGEYRRTAARGVNVRSFDTRTDRQRGGSRPGLHRFVSGQINGTASIQNLSSIVVTSGAVPGSGNTTYPYFGYLQVSAADGGRYRLGTYTASDGQVTAPEVTEAENYISLEACARSFQSGGSNASYTSLGIADGTAVVVTTAVALAEDGGGGTARYIQAVNGKRINSTELLSLPGTTPVAGTFSAVAGTYHYLIGLQGGASKAVLMVAAIDDTGAVAWSNTNVGTTTDNSDISVGTSSTANGSYLFTLLSYDTGVVRCDIADGKNATILASKTDIEGNVGSGYSTYGVQASNSQQRTIAVAGSVLAVSVTSSINVMGVNTTYHGLAFVSTSGGFALTAVTGFSTSPAMPNTAGFSSSRMEVVSDGTHFYIACFPGGGGGTTYQPVVKKINGTTGATMWTCTLTGVQPGAGCLAYISGLNSLELHVGYYSYSINPTTGAISGSGVLPGGYLTGAIAPAAAVTTAATTVSTGSASGPVDCLVGVSAGTIKVNYGGVWQSVLNGTAAFSTTEPVIRSAANGEYLYFSDGASYYKYRPADNTLYPWVATQGSLPVDALNKTGRLIATWRGRTVLSGLPADPRNWFMSAVGDPTDWAYTGGISQTPTEAIAGNNSRLGLIAEPITALIPCSDDVMIFGALRSIHVLRGDPNDGGRIDPVTSSIGIAFGDAWCMDPYGNIYFMSNYTGVYRMMPGGKPERISQQIDQLLKTIDLSVTTVTLAWDDVFQCVHIFATPFSAATACTHYVYELRSSSWWAEEFGNNNHNPLCAYTYRGNTVGDHVLLIGSWDGYVRTYDAAATSDDGTAIESEVVIGPVATQDFDTMRLKDLQGVLSADSGNVTFDVYLGSSPEVALRSTSQATGTWSAGRNLTSPVRRADHAFYVGLSSNNYWSMESIRARVMTAGKVNRRGR